MSEPDAVKTPDPAGSGKADPASRLPRGVRRGLLGTAAGLILVGALLATAWWLRPIPPAEPPLPENLDQLEKAFARARPAGLFVVVDTAANRLYLRKGDEVLLDAACSTGSGLKLVTDQRDWTFQTPRGVFRIISKTENPVWRKPDWAFLEEGEPPPARESERFERGVLGEYALGIGDGYFIHGTLYSRLLGRNVTHGCIRLGASDLEYLARTVPMGTRVFIY
jgi:hypothetical protein